MQSALEKPFGDISCYNLLQRSAFLVTLWWNGFSIIQLISKFMYLQTLHKTVSHFLTLK